MGINSFVIGLVGSILLIVAVVDTLSSGTATLDSIQSTVIGFGMIILSQVIDDD